jgi:selenoprotein W-related protein
MDKYRVRIEFCMAWNYAPYAARVAEELFNEFRGQIGEMILVPSSGGVFEVDVDGKRIFSKKELGRHAEEGEVARLMKEAVGR